jgi:FkbM family methyltransferase
MSFIRRIAGRVLRFGFRNAPTLSYAIVSRLARGSENRAILRAMALREQIKRLQSVLRRMEFPNGIHLDRASCFVEMGNLLLSAELVDRYFKSTGEQPIGSEADKLFERLRALGIEVRCFVDVGANFGEYSLWVAKNTNARVLAIEPSSENLKVFETNAGRNGIDPARFTLVKKAIADRSGQIEMTTGRSQGNSIVNVAGRSETVECDTLDHCLRENKIFQIDVLKIDIEGAEPLLARDLAKWLAKTQCIVMEMGGGMNSADAYESLAALMIDHGFACELHPKRKALTLEGVRQHIRSGHYDFLFYRKLPTTAHSTSTA